MNDILKLFLSLSVSGSIIALFLFVLMPIFKNKLSKTWQYYIWLVVIIRLLIPYTPQVSIVGTFFSSAEHYLMTQSEVGLQDKVSTSTETNTMKKNNFEDPQTFENETTQYQETSNYWDDIKNNIWLLWLVVALLLFVLKLTSYHNFVRFIKAGRHEVTDISIVDIYNTACLTSDIKNPFSLYTNKMATALMVVGIVRPFIVLPCVELHNHELHNIFIHELTHYKRLDIFYKWLTQIAVCIHWFNPLVYLISRKINNNCELSCDEVIIKRLNSDGKKQYGNTFISSLRINGNYGDTIVSITLNEDARLLKERLGAIMNFNKKTKLAVSLSMFLSVVILVMAIFTGAYAANNSPTTILKDKKIEQDKGTKQDLNLLDTIEFAHFKDEPIIWKIVNIYEKDGRREVLLLSENILPDTTLAFDKKTNIWNNSSIRKWLNGTAKNQFLNEFTQNEIGAIIPVDLSNRTDEDKVYLISIDEYNKYKIFDLFKSTSDVLYWTRTPSVVENVNYLSMNNSSNGQFNVTNKLYIRPMLKVDLNSSVFSKKVVDSLTTRQESKTHQSSLNP